MDISLSEEQELLQGSARDFLQQECPIRLVRAMEDDEQGYDLSLWKQMADLGWLGLVLPEEHGGAGGTMMDLAVLLEEFDGGSNWLAACLGWQRSAATRLPAETDSGRTHRHHGLA
jgi:alkylation response protein AidB-like acyl-CoA dehydrogenase